MVVDLAARDVSYQSGMVIGALGILLVGIRLVLAVHELSGRGDSLHEGVFLIKLLLLLLVLIRLVAGSNLIQFALG